MEATIATSHALGCSSASSRAASGTTQFPLSDSRCGTVPPVSLPISLLRNVEEVHRQVGARLVDVVQTPRYVRDIARLEEVGRDHGEVRPATRMVEISGLSEPGMLVEVDASAVIPTPRRGSELAWPVTSADRVPGPS